MAVLESRTLPQQYINQLGQDYGQQLAGLTAIPLDTSTFAPSVAAQDPTFLTSLKENIEAS